MHAAFMHGTPSSIPLRKDGEVSSHIEITGRELDFSYLTELYKPLSY